MDTEEGVCYEGWRGPNTGFDAVVGFDMAINCGALVSCGEWRGVSSPSRTRNPMSLQSIVLTGGGGNAMLTMCEEVFGQ